MNFHYFLGYARNFRELHFKGHIKGRKTPNNIFSLIQKDAEVSAVLYSGIRQAEWLLRHHIVQRYAQKYDSTTHFLRPETYLNLGSEYTNELLVTGLVNDILEYSEHYVVRQIENKRIQLGLKERPRRCHEKNLEECIRLLEPLPIWSVIDSFSLGRLVKFIQRCDGDDDPEQHLWKEVANDLDIPCSRFHAGMDSLRSLRNLVSHQARLWMRPTTYTANKQGIFRKEMRQCDKKSMLVAFYNVASFQGSIEHRREFASKFEALTSGDPNYKFGISNFGGLLPS